MEKVSEKIDHGKLKYQVLLTLKEKGVLTEKEIVEKMANYFHLSEEEREERYSKRPYDKVFYKKVASNEEHLRFAGLEEFTPQGHKITPRGLDALKENPEKIPLTYLKRFPEYCKWVSEGRRQETNDSEIIDFDSLFETKQNKQNMSKEDFLELIKELRTIFKENEWCFRASEENVRAELIDPILSALGWKMPFLRREDHGKDYLLCSEKYVNKESMRVIIEAKKYKEQLLSQVSNNDEKNKLQLLRYCKAANVHIYGILTNGRKWIKYEFQNSYTDLIFVSEIDLLKDDDDTLYSFFWSISFNEIKNGLCGITKIQPHNSVERCPTNIVIDGQSFGKQGDANYHVAKKFLKYCVDNDLNPYDFNFKNKIISQESPKNSYGGERTCKEYKINGKKYYLIGDYGIYVKTALLKEINSTLDLGMSISAE